jgi:hypothetical protein
MKVDGHHRGKRFHTMLRLRKEKKRSYQTHLEMYGSMTSVDGAAGVKNRVKRRVDGARFKVGFKRNLPFRLFEAVGCPTMPVS